MKVSWHAGYLPVPSQKSKSMTSLLFLSKLEIYLSVIFAFSLIQQVHTVHPLGIRHKFDAEETKMNILWSLVLRSLQSMGEE